MKTWFTADLHFGHKNILQYCKDTRKVDSIDKMDSAIIANWQRDVSPEDEVYIVGDMFFCQPERAVEILVQLPGRKHLVLGNHDRVVVNNLQVSAEFKSISQYKTVNIDGKYVVMFHYPIVQYDKMHYGAIHLYGHVHGKYEHPGRGMDVGIDTRPNQDMTLWSWDEVREYCMSRPVLGHH